MSNNATMWSQSNCPYCVMASKLLWDHGYTVVEHKIGVNATKEEFQEIH
jgi:glutaredoxin